MSEDNYKNMIPEKSPLRQFIAQLPCIQYDKKGQGTKPPKTLSKFIVMEGADGAGNSTQARLLEQRLKDSATPCERSTEPTSGTIGRHIRSILQVSQVSQVSQNTQKDTQEDAQNTAEKFQTERSKLAEYFAADRAEHIWGLGGVEEKTQKGIICISERYLFSSLVYQSLDPDCTKSLEEVWQLNRDFPLPQYFFYLDIPSEVAEQRIAQRQTREIFERVSFLKQVRQAYQALIAHLRQLDTGIQIHILDACRPPKELQEIIYSTLQKS